MSIDVDKIDSVFMRMCSLIEGDNFQNVMPYLSFEESEAYEEIMINSALAGIGDFAATNSMEGMHASYKVGLRAWVDSVALDRKIMIVGIFGGLSEDKHPSQTLNS